MQPRTTPAASDVPIAELRQVLDHASRPSFTAVGVYAWLRSRECEGSPTDAADLMESTPTGSGIQAIGAAQELYAAGLIRYHGVRLISRHADGGAW